MISATDTYRFGGTQNQPLPTVALNLNALGAPDVGLTV